MISGKDDHAATNRAMVKLRLIVIEPDCFENNLPQKKYAYDDMLVSAIASVALLREGDNAGATVKYSR